LFGSRLNAALGKGMPMAAQDKKRVDEIYKKLTGRNSRPGEWSIERHAFAQKIVHVEDACKSVLEAIRKLDEADFDADLRQIERDLRREFQFLGTLEGYD
jgi:hypothetical protein